MEETLSRNSLVLGILRPAKLSDRIPKNPRGPRETGPPQGFLPVENEINGAPVMGLRKPPNGRPPFPEGPVSTKAGRAPPGLAWSVGHALGRLF